ncbi:kinase-like protein [Auricularia subglabra TFB-10046 SS5]|nr:kinase-like protein [Auricularia subglabra TFB-10046 SS5]
MKLLRRVKEAVEGDAYAIWKNQDVETMFWNFAYQLPQEISGMTDGDRALARESFLFIKSRVLSTSASGKRTGAVLHISFPPEAQNQVHRLREALASNDVDGIFDYGPACQARQDRFNAECQDLQIWLRRQFVLLELSIGVWDHEGRIAQELTDWVDALDDAIGGYNTWLGQFDAAGSDSDHSMASADTAVSDPEEVPSPHVKVDSDVNHDNVATPSVEPEIIKIGDVTCEDLSAGISIAGNMMIDGLFSTVHKAMLVRNGRSEPVAVKFLHSRGLEPSVMYRRFRREFLVWTSVQPHDNILPIYGVYLGPHNDLPALVSPWCNAGNLIEYVGARRKDKYPVISLCLDLLEQVLSAVKYLHEHDPPIIHGDLKGRNILVSGDVRLQLCDFGLSAVHVEQSSMSLMSTNPVGRGTVPFMSPELITSTPATEHSDMWAVSSVFVEMFSGQLPYHEVPNVVGIILAIVNGQLPARPTGLSNELWDLITTNWHRTPERRLSARNMSSRILRLRAGYLAGEPDAHRQSVRFEV